MVRQQAPRKVREKYMDDFALTKDLHLFLGIRSRSRDESAESVHHYREFSIRLLRPRHRFSDCRFSDPDMLQVSSAFRTEQGSSGSGH